MVEITINYLERIMKYNFKKNIILIIVFIISIVLFVMQEFLFIDNWISRLFNILINSLTFLYFVIFDIFNNRKEIYRRGSYNIFYNVDRNELANNVNEELKKNESESPIMCINTSGLNNAEITNIKTKLYTSLAKVNKKDDIIMTNSISFDELNQFIFKASKRKKTILILDDEIIDISTIKSIHNQFIKLSNSNSEDKQFIGLNNLKIIYLTSKMCNSEYNKIFYFDKNIQTDENIEKLLGEYLKLLPKNINISVLTVKLILTNEYYKSVLNENNRFIRPIYFMAIGEYKEAFNSLMELSCIKNNENFLFLLSDCLHLLGEYNISYTILSNLKLKDGVKNSPLLLEKIEKLEIHINKHLGNFNIEYNKYSIKTDEDIQHLLSIEILKNIDKSISDIDNNKDIKLDELLNSCCINLSCYLPRYEIYKAVIFANKYNLDEALTIINESINNLENSNDRYKYNAYYVKAEILRCMNQFNEAYQFYIKSSGILDCHADINLIDQNFFSTKTLEILGYVRGDASSRIETFKKRSYDANNHKKEVLTSKSIKKLSLILGITELEIQRLLNEKIDLKFNSKLLNLVSEKMIIDEDYINQLKKLIKNNIFIIL